MVERKVGQGLHEAARPRDRHLRDALALAQAEQQLLGVLGDEPGACLHDPCGTALVRLDGDARADRIAIALRSRESKRECGVAGGEVVAEKTKLRRRARRHQDHVRVAVAVVVEDREGSTVLVQVESHGAGDLVEAAAAVVPQQHLPFVARLRPVSHEEPVGRAPRVVVWRAGLADQRRLRAVTCRQKKLSTSTYCSSLVAREHAVHDVDVLPAVVVEVEGIGGPGPAAELRAAPASVTSSNVPSPRFRKSELPRACRRYSSRTVGWRVGHEPSQSRHALSGGRPHVAGVDVQVAVVVVVQERRAHARAVVLDAGWSRHVLEAHLAVHQSPGCGTGSSCRSRSRRAGPASRPRRSRPTRRRS